MHYNKMIYYIAPGLLHYMALRLPIGVESWFKSKRYPGGVQVKKITCIPDSGGCVDIEFALSGLYDNDDNDFNDDDNMEVKDEDGTMSTMAATDVSAASNGEDEGRRRRRLGRKSPSSPASAAFHDEGGLPSNNNYQAAASYNRSIHDTVGKYIKLHIPDLSSQSHPFTIFAQCCTPTTRRQSSSSIDSVHILFRPIGSFTKSLSKRLQALTLHSLPESHGRIRSSRDKSKCPKMFMNGMRCNTLDMFRKATMAHDKVIIIAGGVGIVPYISLIHAIRQHTITTTSNMMHAKEREEDMMNDESIIVKNHLRLIYNDGEVEDDDEEDYGERKRIEDMEQNFSDGTSMSSADSNSTKCIEVHWMSRDEGLIRHVVKNYLEPHCHADDELTSNDMRRYNSNSPPSCPITINFVVHHTSLKSSTVDQVRIESNSNSNDADSDESDPTTWAPSENHVSMEVGGDISPEHYAFPTSVYEGNRSSPIPNVMPTVTYTSIVFGGMRIVNYCYTHIQNKKVFQTRPIAVVGIVAFAMVASLVSYGVILLGELSYSKLFAYAKIGTAHANHDVNSEIEFGLVSDSVGREQIESNDDNDDGNEGHSELYTPAKSNTLSSSCHTKDRPAVMSISHRQGRPDLEALLQNAVKGETHEDIVDNGSSNVGIFMCGPNVMSNSVWKAIKSVENGQSCCSRGTSIAVYQEGFEL
jgi:NAD(P)H-flavin reductase